MDRNELLKYLDIESGAEFQYFEDFANLVEAEAEIESDVIYELLEEVEMESFREIVHNYFEDIMNTIPDSQIDLYNLLENIKRVLEGLSEAVKNEEENALLKLADELNRFRNWYSCEYTVDCRDLESDEESEETVRDALVNSRLEKITGDSFTYDFERALKYELEEYIMTYADLIAEAEYEEMEETAESDEFERYDNYES